MDSINELKGIREETKEKLKEDFALIYDKDLLNKDGKQDELIGRLQIKLGKTREEVLILLAGL